MIRILLILAFALQPVVGFGEGVGSRSADGHGLIQPVVYSMGTMSCMMTQRKSCCGMKQHMQIKMQMKMRENGQCGCAIGSKPAKNSAPNPIHFPAEKPTDLRLMNFFSLVSVSPFNVINLTTRSHHGQRISSDDHNWRAQSNFDVLAFLCIRQT